MQVNLTEMKSARIVADRAAWLVLPGVMPCQLMQVMADERDAADIGGSA